MPPGFGKMATLGMGLQTQAFDDGTSIGVHDLEIVLACADFGKDGDGV